MPISTPIAGMDLLTAQKSLLLQSDQLDEHMRKMREAGTSLLNLEARPSDGQVAKLVSEYIILINNFLATVERIEELSS